MENYEQQISVVNNRLLLPVKVNGKSVYFLVDTGAAVPLIDINQADKLKFKLKSKLPGTITGIGGEGGEVWHVKDLDVDFHGQKIYQFLATDITSVKDSIKKATDYDIVGIISLQQMQQLGWIIDTAAGKVYFKNKED